MHLLLLLATPYFQFEATYLHTSLQWVIWSGTGNKAAANSRIAAAILVGLPELQGHALKDPHRILSPRTQGSSQSVGFLGIKGNFEPEGIC